MKSYNPELRAQAIRQLETMSERFPNLRLGQMISNATDGNDMFYLDDASLLRMLQNLYATYTQFDAAGIPRKDWT